MIPSSSVPGPVKLHARHQHGGHPVVVHGDTYEVQWPTGNVTYDSARKLLRALYNDGNTEPDARDPGMTFDRYFRLGTWAPQDDGPSVLSLFGASESTPDLKLRRAPAIRTSRTRARQARRPRVVAATAAALTTLSLFGTPTANAKVESPAIIEMRWADRYALSTNTRPAKAKSGLSVAPEEPKLGVDLVNRSHEVKKLLFAGFGAKIARAGYDPDDVLQEVFRGILARNKGKCPFDPRKSSFGHYVHMVCGCILANYHRKQNRRAEFEQLGMYTYQGSDADEYDGLDDASVAASSEGSMFSDAPPTDFVAGETQALTSLYNTLEVNGSNPDGSMRPEAVLAMKALPLVYQGFTRSEIARELGTDPSRVGRSLAFLRRVSTEWRTSQNLV